MILPLLWSTFLIIFAIVSGEGCGDNCLCGISNNIPEYEEYNDGISQNRILGGKDSDPKNWPFLVRYGESTASIIHPRWVLSASHCARSNNPNVTTINGETYEAEAIFRHELYGHDFVNDIMLVKLKEPLEFSENISSVCLLRNLTAAELETAAAVGYGVKFIRISTINDTYTEGELNEDQYITIPSGRLRETPILIKDWSWCEGFESFNETRVCAGGINHGTTIGDSGGPLLLIRDHRWVQLGITSVGSTRAIPGDLLAMKDLGAYTRVSAYCDWIEETTSGEVTFISQVLAAKNAAAAKATTTTKKAKKTTTTTTTTTTTPKPENGFVKFLEGASDFNKKVRVSLGSPCGIVCNFFNRRKRQSNSLDSWLQGFNIKESDAKGIDEKDIEQVIEKNYGLPSPAMASLQARNIL